MSVSLSQFPALAAGSVLYLSSPGAVCDAVKEGRWLEETQHFLHKVTHGEEEHQHRREADGAGHDHDHDLGHTHEADHHHDHEHGAEDDGHHRHQHEEADGSHNHEHIDTHGLKVLLDMLHDHYDPINNEVSGRLLLSQCV